MTLATTASRASYLGTGIVGPFAYPFRVFAATDLRVTVLSAAGVETQLTYGLDYSVTGVGDASGNVTLTTALPADGSQVVIRRTPALTQATSIRNQGPYFASDIENALDKLAMVDQKQQDELDRSLKLGETSTPTGLTTTLPFPTAGQVLTGTGLGFTMSALDSSAIALPGEGRTVATTSQYLANNRVFQLDDYVPVGVNIKTNVTDGTAYIQAWLDAQIANNGRGKMRFGDYKITSALLGLKVAAGVYSAISLDLEGERVAWSSTTTLQKSTRLLPTHVNTFALGIQNARAVRIRDIALIGQNDFSANVDGALAYLRTNANYVINGCRDSRFSPYAGIVIDPFGTAVPADGGYPGMGAFYTASAGGSASITFENVSVRGFVTNFMLSPSGTLGLCSEVTWRGCISEYAKAGVAIGQNQSRNLHWYGGSNVVALYGFDGNTYGSRTGAAPKIFGCNMSGKYLFNLPQNAGGVLLASGIHAESFFSLGFLGATFATSRAPAKFIGCEFTFGFLGAGPHADRHLYALTPVHFDSCIFDTQSAFAPKVLRIARDNAVPVRWSNCMFAREVQSEFNLGPSVNSGALIMDDLHFESNILVDGGTRGPASGNDRISNRYFVNGESLLNHHTVPFGAEIRLNNAASIADRSWVGPSEANYEVNHGLLAVVVNGDGTFTFTVPDGTIVRTGDLVYTTTAFNIEKYDATTETMPILCLGIVTNVAGNNITADGAPTSLVNGNYTIVTFWWPRYHQATTGDTSTSNSIANVSQPAAWKIGQKIRGSGIPTGTYITNIAGAVFTLSKATTSTLVGTRLYDADVYKVTGTAV